MKFKLRQISARALPAAIAIVAISGCGLPFVSAQDKPASSQDPRQAMLRFTQCLRQHGIDMPDPNSSGAVTIQATAGSAPPPGSDPNDSGFKAAETACQKYMPSGGPKSMTSQDAKANQEKALKFAQCMRQHGLPDFPDPKSDAGGGTTFHSAKDPGGQPGGELSINGQSFSFDPSAPEFQKAEQACRRILGIKGGPPTLSQGGAGLGSGPSTSSGSH